MSEFLSSESESQEARTIETEVAILRERVRGLNGEIQLIKSNISAWNGMLYDLRLQLREHIVQSDESSKAIKDELLKLVASQEKILNSLKKQDESNFKTKILWSAFVGLCVVIAGFVLKWVGLK